MSFKIGDKVSFVNKAIRTGQVGIIIGYAEGLNFPYKVNFPRNSQEEVCKDEELELAEPTTLEKMKEEIKECETCEHAYILKPCTTYPIPKSCWACKSGVPHRTEYKLKIAEPTTLERLAELMASGEEFMIGGDVYLFDTKGSLLCCGWESELTLNAILKYGIQEMPWTPKENENIFYVNDYVETFVVQYEEDHQYTKSLVEKGNCFRTKALADIVRNQILEILKEANHG